MAKLCVKNMVASMNKRLAIQEEVQTADGQGGFTAEWVNIANVWASILPLNGYEKFQASQIQTPVTHKITMRYRNDITTKNRLVYDDRIFNIKELLNVNEDNSFLQLKCLEKA